MKALPVSAIRSPDLRSPEGEEIVGRLRPRDPESWAVREKTRADALPPDTWREEPAVEARNRRRSDEKRRELARARRSLLPRAQSAGRTSPP